jgi:5-(carboxyamino)imidazole ribonucleotide synthase
VVASDIEHLRQ